MTRTLLRARRRQAGFTLVELLVSLVIGFAVVGALLAAYMASFRGTRQQDAMVQMAEDATLALNVIRAQVAMAGYSSVVAVTPGGLTLHTFASKPLFGCAGSQFGTPLDPIITAALPCVATPPGTPVSDTIEVAYEATNDTHGSNGILGPAASGNAPLDCLGNAIPLTNDGVGTAFYLNDSKFYVQGGSLYCHAAGATPGAPLVDHVEKLSVTYGLAAADLKSLNQIVTYAPAPALASTDWQRVVSATICIEVRSADKVLDQTNVATLSTYIDCAGKRQTTVTDGYLRRSFATTVVLQNRLL
jgi:type IV pilus assembly protein PilW